MLLFIFYILKDDFPLKRFCFQLIFTIDFLWFSNLLHKFWYQLLFTKNFTAKVNMNVKVTLNWAVFRSGFFYNSTPSSNFLKCISVIHLIRTHVHIIRFRVFYNFGVLS